MGESVCERRCSEDFGQEWKSADGNGRKEIHKKVQATVKASLVQHGFPITNQSIVTLVYAAALCPTRPVIAFILEAFRDDDRKAMEVNAAVAAAKRKVNDYLCVPVFFITITRQSQLIVTTSYGFMRRVYTSYHTKEQLWHQLDPTCIVQYVQGEQPDRETIMALARREIKCEALSLFLGLDETLQLHPFVRSQFVSTGVSEQLRNVCNVAVVIEIVQSICKSVVLREHVPPAVVGFVLPSMRYDCFFEVLSDFVSEREAAFFQGADGEKNIKSLLHSVAKWLPVLMEMCGVKLDQHVKVGRKPLLKAQNRVTAKYKSDNPVKRGDNPLFCSIVDERNPDKKSSTVPNAGSMPHLPTSGALISFTQDVWREWVSELIFFSKGSCAVVVLGHCPFWLFRLLCRLRHATFLSVGRRLELWAPSHVFALTSPPTLRAPLTSAHTMQLFYDWSAMAATQQREMVAFLGLLTVDRFIVRLEGNEEGSRLDSFIALAARGVPDNSLIVKGILDRPKLQRSKTYNEFFDQERLNYLPAPTLKPGAPPCRKRLLCLYSSMLLPCCLPFFFQYSMC